MSGYTCQLYMSEMFGLLSRGEAIRDKPAQYISMGARVTVRIVPNMEALPCLQISVQRDKKTALSARTGPGLKLATDDKITVTLQAHRRVYSSLDIYNRDNVNHNYCLHNRTPEVGRSNNMTVLPKAGHLVPML